MAFIESWVLILFVLATVDNQTGVVEAQYYPGVCFGRQGDNLPPASQVVALYKQYGIRNMRLFNPDLDVLTALENKGIELTLGMRNQDLPNLVDINAAKAWYDKYVQSFRYVAVVIIAVGNEAIPGEFSQSVLPVMKNFQSIMDRYHETGIKITTVVSLDVMGSSYPPSAGAFRNEFSGLITDVLGFLQSRNYPVMLNAYPYFAYASNLAQIPLDYALFTAPSPVVHDDGLEYWNLLDAMVDSVYAAMEKVGMPQVDILVSESRWPSAGNGNFTTTSLAATYNRNLHRKLRDFAGTPRRLTSKLSGYIFSMFNEDLKPPGVEQNWGLFYPDGTPVDNVFG